MSRVIEELKTSSVSGMVLLGVGVGALVAGAFLGNTTSLGAKNLTVLEGQAFLHNTDNWLTSFETWDADDLLAFRADTVAWSDEDSSGSDHPPCLEEGQRVPVRLGYTRVNFPGGGGRSVVAWVECLR